MCQGARKAFKMLEFSVSSLWLILLNEMKMQFTVTCKVKKKLTNKLNKSVLEAGVLLPLANTVSRPAQMRQSSRTLY